MLGFEKTYTTPFEEDIPILIDDYFNKVSKYKRFRRFLGRYIYARFALKSSQKLEKIPCNCYKILWIQWVNPNLGDSLTDLSGRILLNDKKIDLLTRENAAIIYQDDEIFNKVYIDPKDCADNGYDLVIIDSYRQRSLKVFKKYFSNTPHVSLYGFYSVYDFHQLYFSFFRVNQFLTKPFCQKYIRGIANPLLSISGTDKLVVENYNISANTIAIAIGGVERDRTYNFWKDVIELLLSHKVTDNIVLLGLKDAVRFDNIDNTINMIGRCTFNQSAQIVKKSRLLICADGGLLHAANAVKTPVVCLFYGLNPNVRLIKGNKSIALYNSQSINDILPKDILKSVLLLQVKISS
jgi:hypothetical protein